MNARAKYPIEYRLWSGMKSRCSNASNRSYHNYGGRGIKVCEEWSKSFEAFINDIGARPSADLSLDRINPDGDYVPGNVRWAPRWLQNRNKRKESKNSSGIKGVSFDKQTGRWFAHIKVDGRPIALGRYVLLEQAAKARANAELTYWGADLNLPPRRSTLRHGGTDES